ncbi:MAG TPA: sugar nucleotide-binding protein, partial [Flavisolibacter sp.]|nr:sugar nucleotide-binding protein [Flavisolibacter sp.]
TNAWSIVRTVLVYGKSNGDRLNIVTNVAKGLKEGKQLKIFSDQMRTPTYVEDLALGIVALIDKKAVGIYHISGEEKYSPYEMAVTVAKYLGYDANLVQNVVEKDFHQPARRPPKTGFDLSKAKRDLNYQPISFYEGLKKTFSEIKHG